MASERIDTESDSDAHVPERHAASNIARLRYNESSQAQQPAAIHVERVRHVERIRHDEPIEHDGPSQTQQPATVHRVRPKRRESPRAPLITASYRERLQHNESSPVLQPAAIYSVSPRRSISPQAPQIPGIYNDRPQPRELPIPVHTPYGRSNRHHFRPPATTNHLNTGFDRSSFERIRPRHGQHHSWLGVASRRVERHERASLPSWVDPDMQSDDEGGYYNSRDPQARAVYPSICNAQNTTSNYYNGGLGDAAWRRKKRKRAGLEPPDPDPNPDLGPPQHASILCFVTIRGKLEIAEPAAQFGWRFRTKECDDAYFAAFLNEEYGRITARARWYGRAFSFKTIAAVEFQTWKLTGRAWSLADVDSIPETATRTTMSHFSYQLRHPFVGGRHWVNKLERLLKAADQVHASGHSGSGSKWNFRIHIIEMIDVRAIYLAVSFAILPSAAAGIVYGFFRDDFGTAFTVASYVLASFSLLFAVLATAEFLGIETPDCFAANDVYKHLEIDSAYFPGNRK
ncbi:hypothetical protein HD806DRAFT_516951 [Xylariaceae sp. AK1471]|nr:hypothetical protein HD806DRAFT_516951 [Xylariaceae sp. AK1471]